MNDFVGDLLDRIDASGQSFTQRAFEVLSRDIEPLLRLLILLAVVFYGAQLILGSSRLSAAEIVGRLARAMVIFVIVTSWSNFNDLAYTWITTVPEAAGRAILAASGTGIVEPSNGLSQIWETANVAAAAFSEQAGYLSVLPALIGLVIVLFAGLFVAAALGILVLAKVVLWVLLGTAPIFVSAFFFEPTRSYAMGWISQTFLYAIIPLFVFVIAAFLIAAMQPELTKINEISGNRELTLSDFAAFIMLCLAGTFVLFQVQHLAQGVAGGVAMPVGAQSYLRTRQGVLLARAVAGRSARETRAAVLRVQARLIPTSQSGARTSMQRAISSSGRVK